MIELEHVTILSAVNYITSLLAGQLEVQIPI